MEVLYLNPLLKLYTIFKNNFTIEYFKKKMANLLLDKGQNKTAKLTA